MSAGRAPGGSGGLGPQGHLPGAPKRGRPEDSRWWESNPGRTVPSRGRPTGRVRHAFPAAMPSARSRVRRIRVRCPANFRVATKIHCPVRDLSSHRTAWTRRSREIRLTWKRVGRILRRGVRLSRPEEGADFDGTPNEQADVAPGALPRAARHRADLWLLLVRQSGPAGPGGILVSGDSPVAVFEEPPPRGGSFLSLHQFLTSTRSAVSDEIQDRDSDATPRQPLAAPGVARPRIRHRFG